MKAIIANELEKKPWLKYNLKEYTINQNLWALKQWHILCMNTWIIPFHTRSRERNIKASWLSIYSASHDQNIQLWPRIHHLNSSITGRTDRGHWHFAPNYASYRAKCDSTERKWGTPSHYHQDNVDGMNACTKNEQREDLRLKCMRSICLVGKSWHLSEDHGSLFASKQFLSADKKQKQNNENIHKWANIARHSLHGTQCVKNVYFS